MAIKKKDSGGGGANWMDTYGDMVTLLLCFFVLLYSMSTISEEKWRAIVTSFNPFAIQDATDPEGNDGPVADPDQNKGGEPTIPDVAAQREIEEDIEELFLALQSYAAQNGENNITVTKGDGKVFISFNQAVFFDGDSATLRRDSYPVLDAVGEMLGQAAGSIDEVRVLGHTAQISSGAGDRIREDRTIASLRATNVVIYIQQQGVLEPGRLISEGVGQWRPIADNHTAEGRAKNRRVEMIVSGRDLQKELESGMTSYTTSDYMDG